MTIDTTETSAVLPTRKWNVETPVCPKCSNRVYFAEQVNYITTRSFTYSIELFSKGKGCGKDMAQDLSPMSGVQYGARLK